MKIPFPVRFLFPCRPPSNIWAQPRGSPARSPPAVRRATPPPPWCGPRGWLLPIEATERLHYVSAMTLRKVAGLGGLWPLVSRPAGRQQASMLWSSRWPWGTDGVRTVSKEPSVQPLRNGIPPATTEQEGLCNPEEPPEREPSAGWARDRGLRSPEPRPPLGQTSFSHGCPADTWAVLSH